MKIVQTFWSGNQTAENYLHNKAGWLSAEYHWMSWALSSLQIRAFYDELELITDGVGKQFFEEVLDLPFTTIKAELDVLNQYDNRLWALAKIYAYSLQKEPFIHLDSDVFIWKRFDKNIENADLIAQNIEIDFPFYHEPLGIMQEKFKNVPACMSEELDKGKSIFSSNTGVIGGHCIEIFQEYKRLAFSLIDDNLENIHLVEIKHFNICFEQFLYYCLAKQKAIPLSVVVDNAGEFDPTYPNYADFHLVPEKVWYIHAMAEYKRKPEVCHHLARRLRQDHGVYYYRIIENCLATGVGLDWQCYPLSKLDELWLGFYERDKAIYKNAEVLFLKSNAAIMATSLIFDTICQIEESETPVYSQTLIYPDITKLAYTRFDLDSLNMVLLDAFLEPKSIETALNEIVLYFKEENPKAISDTFKTPCLSRIKDLMYLGCFGLKCGLFGP